jgi:hypothetical protein
MEQAVALKCPGEMARGGNPATMAGALDKELGNFRLDIDDKVLGNVTVTSSKPLLQLASTVKYSTWIKTSYRPVAQPSM